MTHLLFQNLNNQHFFHKIKLDYQSFIYVVKNEANRNLYVDHHQVSVGDVISPVAEGIEGRRELFLVDVA